MSLKQHFLSWSHVVAIGSIAILLAACGDDSGSSSGPSDSASENEVEMSSDDSGKAKSSSSVEKIKSSSSKKTVSSSSVGKGKSSSSVGKTISSSSKKTASSSSAGKDKSSSSVGKTSSSSSAKTTSSSTDKVKSSSSSEKVVFSSSSAEIKLSSSNKVESSSSAKRSSSSIEVSSSSFVDFEVWNWDVSKDLRLNPEITYGTMTDSRDGKKYKTVKIGDQTWMAENLNYADSIKTPILKGRSWCYNDVSANCDVAGRLYSWVAAIDSVKLATDKDHPRDCGLGKTCSLPDTVYGICPPGWHLPDTTEWNTLLTTVGGLSVSKALKSQTGWLINTKYNINGNGTDTFGFSALPVGLRHNDGRSLGESENANFWSSTECGNLSACDRYLDFQNENALLGYDRKDSGLSVRCIENSK